MMTQEYLIFAAFFTMLTLQLCARSIFIRREGGNIQGNMSRREMSYTLFD